MSIGRICQRGVDTIAPNETVLTAAERMRQRTVGCLVVVDEGQRPIGVVTDRDLVLRVVAADRSPGMTTVREVMTNSPDFGREDMPIEAGLGIMRRTGCRRLPVVDKAGRLVGLVTLDDILMLLAGEFMQIDEILGCETPSSAAMAV